MPDSPTTSPASLKSAQDPYWFPGSGARTCEPLASQNAPSGHEPPAPDPQARPPRSGGGAEWAGDPVEARRRGGIRASGGRGNRGRGGRKAERKGGMSNSGGRGEAGGGERLVRRAGPVTGEED